MLGMRTDWQNLAIGEIDIDGPLRATRAAGYYLADFEGWWRSGDSLWDWAG
jgi:hypothetical protein